MSMMRGQKFLNGRTFEMEAVADDERVRLGTTEIWEFVNDSPMAHPMHIHNLHFRVIERSGGESRAQAGRIARRACDDGGLKDVVLVLPGQRGQGSDEVRGPHRALSLSLPYPRARRFGNDAQLPGRGERQVRPIFHCLLSSYDGLHVD
jgi:FtsP/CotA-like multicopper oxidase with cupredoxin domain